MSKAGSVPISRFYTVIAIVCAVVGSLAFFLGESLGKEEARLERAAATIQQQRSDNEILTEEYEAYARGYTNARDYLLQH